MASPAIVRVVLAGQRPDGKDEEVALGTVAERVENEAIDLEYLDHDIREAQLELAKNDIGVKFLAKKDEVMAEWADHQKQWEYLDEDVKEIRPQMAALDKKLELMRKYYMEQTKPTSDKIKDRNDLLKKSNEQLVSVMTEADEVCEAQKKLKGSKSNFLDQRSCLIVILVLCAALSVIVVLSLLSKLGL